MSAHDYSIINIWVNSLNWYILDFYEILCYSSYHVTVLAILVVQVHYASIART